MIIVIATGVALIGSVVLGWALANRVLKPIDDITRSAAQITAAADLKTRLNWNGPMDELGRLVSVFNSAMERLEHLFSVQQRFVADVSHELRTPLTAISGNVELIKRYGMDHRIAGRHRKRSPSHVAARQRPAAAGARRQRRTQAQS